MFLAIREMDTRFGLRVCAAMCCGLFGLLAIASPLQANEPPNILLVIADDLGLDASPCYDFVGEKPHMPFVERMCSEGVVFDNFYTAPVCSPTRATIMTGRYGFRTGVGTAVSPKSTNGLPPSETTIFQVLDAHAPQEYAHAVFGKWHLANQANGGVEHPEAMGVGTYAGVIDGTVEDYFSWPRTSDGETQTVNQYVTSALTDDALDWANAQTTPWFLWLAHIAPHLPAHLPPADLHTRSDLSGDQQDLRRNPLDYYLASLEALDTELGRLIDSLPDAVRSNLLVIFIGDNGAPNRVAQAPFSRGKVKGTLFEGGVHAPLIVWGAGVERAGEREAGLVNSTDLFATIAALVGVDAENYTGVAEDSLSFAPALRDTGKVIRDYVYVEHFSEGGPRGQQRQQFGWAVRDARWKYLRTSEGQESLFDLEADPYEANDLLNGSGADTADIRGIRDRLVEYRDALHLP